MARSAKLSVIPIYKGVLVAKLEEVEGKNAREYLRQVNKKINDLQKEFETIIKSRQAINGAFSNRLENLERKTKNEQ